MNRRTILIGVAMTAVLIVVAGCGRRGALEAPPGASIAPKAAPSQRLVAPVAEVTTTDAGSVDDRDAFLGEPTTSSGQIPPVATAPARPDPNAPRKSFFLDSLVK